MADSVLNSSPIMAWSECTIKVGKTGAADAMATAIEQIGQVKEKSTTLEPSDGTSLKATKSGGQLVAQEDLQGDIVLKTRIIEPSFALDTLFTGAVVTPATELVEEVATVKTTVVADPFSVEVMPKNVGAKGIRIRKSHVKYKPGYSEEEGNYVDIEFTILACADGELYKRFTKKATA
ncbi:hypothetical protein [uncultured Bacteroides sp.]|uniref:hypothetical protein n=1 Tax=uncultured Bacteroides sp. TaxID=162156 RepID=UPI002AAB5670|nr:hypothetical protein [uncultured Bacteroides sp.]